MLLITVRATQSDPRMIFAVAAVAHGEVRPNVKDLTVWVAFGPGHLYFLLLIAQLYLLLLVLPRSRRGLILFAAAALALQLGLGVYHTYGPLAPGPMQICSSAMRTGSESRSASE